MNNIWQIKSHFRDLFAIFSDKQAMQPYLVLMKRDFTNCNEFGDFPIFYVFDRSNP